MVKCIIMTNLRVQPLLLSYYESTIVPNTYVQRTYDSDPHQTSDTKNIHETFY